ncbi:MAG: hypothetical protein JKP98_04220 [Rhodobacteraceae bacterium]|nr:hypothetical protein [Paracoccaceae bacterium]
MNGIVTDHRGDGALGVTMAGAVTGGTGAGVENAATSQGGQFVLQDGGSIQADSGLAFADLADGSTGDASSTLDIAGALNGDAQMGAGGDTLILRDTATLAPASPSMAMRAQRAASPGRSTGWNSPAGPAVSMPRRR